MHFPTDSTALTTAFDGPVVDHWLERKIDQTALHPPCRLNRMIPTFTGECSTVWAMSYPLIVQSILEYTEKTIVLLDNIYSSNSMCFSTNSIIQERDNLQEQGMCSVNWQNKTLCLFGNLSNKLNAVTREQCVINNLKGFGCCSVGCVVCGVINHLIGVLNRPQYFTEGIVVVGGWLWKYRKHCA